MLPNNVCKALRRASEAWEAEARTLFKRIDTDGDGALNVDDLSAVLSDKGRDMLDLADVDHDGVVSQIDWFRMLGVASEDERGAIMNLTGALVAGVERATLVGC